MCVFFYFLSLHKILLLGRIKVNFLCSRWYYLCTYNMRTLDMKYIALPNDKLLPELRKYDADGHVVLLSDKVYRLSFYLAMEEYVARHVNEEDCFFMWQVNPSVIFGRNQLIENEVNIDYCRENGISMFRRKSGGGCVYADMNNVMFSYITKEVNVGFTFNRYINMVAAVLRKLGVEAIPSGRNDIMIEGRKVSGNAFYLAQGKSIVHGTMLYDTDMRNMVGAITPSSEKLLSKGVESVRQHIALLKDYIDISIDEFLVFVMNHLCDGCIRLTDKDVKEIEEIEREYLTDEFVFGNNPRYMLVRKSRIDGVGDMEIRIEAKNNIIKKVNMLGDYFIVGDIDTGLLKRLIGVALQKENLEKALPDDLSEYVLNLKKEDFINILLG